MTPIKKYLIPTLNVSVRVLISAIIVYEFSHHFFTAQLLQIAASVELYLAHYLPEISSTEAAKLRKMHALYPPLEHPLPVLLYSFGVFQFLSLSSKNKTLINKIKTGGLLAIGCTAWTLSSLRIAEMHFAVIIANTVFMIVANAIIAIITFLGCDILNK